MPDETKALPCGCQVNPYRDFLGRMVGQILTKGGTILGTSNRSGARFALIVGEAEVAAGRISVKPLREDRPQVLVTVDECAELLGAGARSA